MLKLEDHIKTTMPTQIVGTIVQTDRLTIVAADFPALPVFFTANTASRSYPILGH